MSQRHGAVAGFAAYALWGIFPLVFRLLDDVSAVEILFHRIVWSFVVVVLLLAAGRRVAELTTLRADRRALRALASAAAVISVNWLTYIWAVNSGHVVDAALGYYINPLITVALGVLVLRERLRPAQRAALALGAAAVVVLTVAHGTVPWIALILATSFAAYGYLKKSADVAAVPSLAVETALLLPLATAGLLVLGVAGDLSFTNGSVGRDLLLLGLGVVTAVPLLLFAVAATRIPLALLGLLQYVTPTMQLLCGVVLLGEDLAPGRLAGFVLVWLALSVLATDAVSAERRARRGALAPG